MGREFPMEMLSVLHLQVRAYPTPPTLPGERGKLKSEHLLIGPFAVCRTYEKWLWYIVIWSGILDEFGYDVIWFTIFATCSASRISLRVWPIPLEVLSGLFVLRSIKSNSLQSAYFSHYRSQLSGYTKYFTVFTTATVHHLVTSQGH